MELSFESYLKHIVFEDKDIESDMVKLIKEGGVANHLRMVFNALKECSDIAHKHKGMKHFICGGYKVSGDEHLEILTKTFYEMENLRILFPSMNITSEELEDKFESLIKTHHEIIKKVEDKNIRGMMFIAFFELARISYIFLGFKSETYVEFLKNIDLKAVEKA